jgi:hypothetical protein
MHDARDMTRKSLNGRKVRCETAKSFSMPRTIQRMIIISEMPRHVATPTTSFPYEIPHEGDSDKTKGGISVPWRISAVHRNNKTKRILAHKRADPLNHPSPKQRPPFLPLSTLA